MAKSGDRKVLLFWVLGGIFVYYLLSQFYFAYLSSLPVVSLLFDWFFGLPRYVEFIASLLQMLTKLILLLATPLMYALIGGLLGLLGKYLYQKSRK